MASDEEEKGPQVPVEKRFEVRIKGEGMEVIQSVGQGEVLRVLSVILGDGSETAVPRAQPALGGRTTVGGVQEGPLRKSAEADVSIGEFLGDLQVSNNAERIAGIVLFLKEHHGMPSAARSEFPQWFKRAGVPAPKNLHRDLGNAVKAKLVSEDPDLEGHYFITTSGTKTLRQTEK